MESKKPELTDEEVSKIWCDKHLKRDGQFKSIISCNLCHQVCVSFY